MNHLTRVRVKECARPSQKACPKSFWNQFPISWFFPRNMAPEPSVDRTPDDSLARVLRVGGMSKGELLKELSDNGIQLNEIGRSLFADDRFLTSAASSVMETVQTSVAGLGFTQGATFAEIEARAAKLGLSLCALEVAPYFRLQLLDQPEGRLGHPSSRHRAPPGSITVASRPLSEEDETPWGFYLRRIDGVLWLRGYRSWPGHVWSPEDAFLFTRENSAASPFHQATLPSTGCSCST